LELPCKFLDFCYVKSYFDDTTYLYRVLLS